MICCSHLNQVSFNFFLELFVLTPNHNEKTSAIVAIRNAKRQVRKASQQQATIEITWQILYYCLFAPYISGCCSSRTQNVCGESHIQRNANQELATISFHLYACTSKAPVLSKMPLTTSARTRSKPFFG